LTLDEILNSVSIPLEVGDTRFRLVGFSAAKVTAWNRVLYSRGPEEADVDALLEHRESQRARQLELMAEHMRACITEGKKAKVTAEWLSESVPQAILQDLAEWFVEGKRPAWAGEPGN
jgi:hypothetical protein